MTSGAQILRDITDAILLAFQVKNKSSSKPAI